MKFILEVVSEHPLSEPHLPISERLRRNSKLALVISEDGRSMIPVDIGVVPGLEAIPAMAMLRIVPSPVSGNIVNRAAWAGWDDEWKPETFLEQDVPEDPEVTAVLREMRHEAQERMTALLNQKDD